MSSDGDARMNEIIERLQTIMSSIENIERKMEENNMFDDCSDEEVAGFVDQVNEISKTTNRVRKEYFG